MGSDEGELKRVRIKAADKLKQLMADYYHDTDEAVRDPGRKVAWNSSLGPHELIDCFGFSVYYPENHSAMLGALRKANDYIPYANSIGYSPDICSYLTADIGAFLKGETPLERFGIREIPKPDVIVYNTNQCRDVKDWFYYYAQKFDVPFVGVTPVRHIRGLTSEILEGSVRQLKRLAEQLEEISGVEYDEEHLRDSVRAGADTTRLWKEILDLGQHVPSPITIFDTLVHLFPVVTMRAWKEAASYYRELKAEIQERVDNGTAAVPGEKHRLYWDGMPIWGRVRMLSELFSQLEAAVVASTYAYAWTFPELDPDRPWESMAKAYTNVHPAHDEYFKERYFLRMAEDLRLDGLIFHDAKTCPYTTNSRYGMPQRFKEKYGIATLVIDGDLNDLRCFSDEQATTKIEAFIEQLGGQEAQ